MPLVVVVAVVMTMSCTGRSTAHSPMCSESSIGGESHQKPWHRPADRVYHSTLIVVVVVVVHCCYYYYCCCVASLVLVRHHEERVPMDDWYRPVIVATRDANDPVPPRRDTATVPNDAMVLERVLRAPKWRNRGHGRLLLWLLEQ